MIRAIFSPCRKYRYLLRRRTGEANSTCLFIMLNPSTADEETNDPTIRRCMNFASHWGFGTLEVANIFALRSTDPRRLRMPYEEDPKGPENDSYLISSAYRANLVVAAWGNWGALFGRGNSVLDMLKVASIPASTFGLTRQGEPKHPLYLRSDAALRKVQ